MSIRVLCVDDSKPVLDILVRLLASDPEIEVVGQGADGDAAIAGVQTLAPDVITLDLKMPKVDGLEALRRIRSFCSTPVIIVSSYTQPEARATFEALEAGAFDFLAKPASGNPRDFLSLREQLIRMVKAAHESKTDRGAAAGGGRAGAAGAPAGEGDQAASGLARLGLGTLSDKEIESFEAVGIGCSTGGPLALAAILPIIPKEFPWPIFIVQHMPPFFAPHFAEMLQKKCALSVVEAREGDFATAGHVYLASGDGHLRVRRVVRGIMIELDAETPPIEGCRPAVDALFESLAAQLGSRVLGVLLSGMGHDGAAGLLAMRGKGAVTVVQDRSSAVVYGMPGAALRMGASDHVVKLRELPRFIYQAARARARGFSDEILIDREP